MIAILLASFPGIPELLWSGTTSLSVDDTDGSVDLEETSVLGASVWTSTDLFSAVPLTANGGGGAHVEVRAECSRSNAKQKYKFRGSGHGEDN